MAGLNTKENDIYYDLIIQHKDQSSSNLKEVFESYGLDTLESKVPIVQDPIVDKLQNVDSEQQLYATMALSSEAAQKAIKGRLSRTRNKVLKIVSVGDQTIISAGETRERSPVDEGELDADIEQYMKDKARLKAAKLAELESLQATCSAPSISSNNSESRMVATRTVAAAATAEHSDIGEEDLDEDLDRYMKEAARRKEQMRKNVEQSERLRALEDMEYHFDNLEE